MRLQNIYVAVVMALTIGFGFASANEISVFWTIIGVV